MPAGEGRQTKEKKGSILILVAMSMLTIMGLLALAVDGGVMQRQKRLIQAAADAAAQAGALEIYNSRTDSVIASARSEATRNGYTNGVNGIAVTVTYPTTSGTYIGSNYLSVRIQDTVRTLLAGVLGRSMVVVNARSTSGVTGTTSSCINTMDNSLRDALEVDAGAIVNAVGCTVSVNSNNAEALKVAGASLSASAINVTGGYLNTGTITPNPPTTGAPPATDPMASYVSLSVSDTSGACLGGSYTLFKVTTAMVLNPGIYCGGIQVSKSTGIATLNGGKYVIKGGGLEVSSGGSIIGAGPVNIINLNAPAANGGASRFDVINLASAATVNLSAITTGNLAGILFYSPLNQGDAGHVQLNRIHSGASVTLNGSFYFPDQQMEFSSGGTLTINGGLVAALIHFGSDSRVNITGYAGSSPYSLRRASVVE
jgi:hypothetical protein